MPKISVVMSVYNGERFLKKAIESILNQTYRDFEFIIIDDCSTDHSVNIISSYNDERIRLIRNNKNLRLPASLNKGIRLAKGEYIARMDADDISLPERFAKQVSYLDKHHDVVVLGGSFCAIDENDKELYVRHVLTGKLLKKYLLIPSPLVHPSVMMRRCAIVENNLFYNEHYSSAQDYELWMRISKDFIIENLSDIILKYRLHESSITSAKRQEQMNNTYDVFCRYSPIPISREECMSILRCNYFLSPLRRAIIMYKLFRTCDYKYWRDVIGYTVSYLKKINNFC